MSIRLSSGRGLLALIMTVLVAVGLLSPAHAAGAASTTATVSSASPTELVIDVAGTDFATEAPGVYVGLAERGVTATAASMVGLAYVPAAAMTATGGFSAQVKLDAAAIAGLLSTASYAVHTVRAHNVADPGLSWSTATNVDLDWVALGLVEPTPEPSPTPTPTATSTPTPTPTPTPTATSTATEPVSVVPAVSVSRVEVSAQGSTTVTVTGSGFDPGAVTGTRPPFAGQSGGVYVVFGKFASQWRPSAGAASAARVVGSQVWAVPQAQVGVLGDAGVVLNADGSFTTQLVIDKAGLDAKAVAESLVNYGVFTYPGSGAVSAQFETYTPISFTDPQSPAPATSLVWGVKDSFRTYVDGQGAITVARGVTRTASGFDWPFQAFAERTNTYGGSVRFAAHGGALDITLADPQIRVTSSTTAVLSAAVTSDGVTRRADLGRVALKAPTTDPASGGARFVAAPVTLLDTGVEVFGNYPAGAALDPVTFTIVHSALALGGEPTPQIPPPTTPTSPPGPALPTTPTGPATPPVGTPLRTPHGAGYLTWGVKQSFRDYVVGPIAKGSVVVSGGASSAGSAFRFGQASTAAGENGVGTTSYRGGVRFSGHGGVLSLSISNPTVVVRSSSSADLVVTANGARVTMATLDLASASVSRLNGVVTYGGVPARITAAGRAAFNGYANDYTMLDPVTFAIGSQSSGGAAAAVVVASAQGDEKGWTPPSAPPSTGGAELDGDTFAPGDVVRVSADGFAPDEVGIRVVVYSDPVVLASDVTADAGGRVTWSGTLPSTIEAGEHTLTLQGSVDRGATFTITEVFDAEECAVSDGSLDWGFKESFRSYVSGSIAHGDWETSAPATYATPVFTWPGGAGGVAGDLTSGTITFEGGIRFTGHDGMLDTSISDPRVTFLDAATAVVVVDFASTDRAKAEADGGDPDLVETAGVEFVRLDLAGGEVVRDGDTVALTGVPATLTAQGDAVFPTYSEGDEFDPVDLSFTIATDCASASVEDDGSDTDVTAVAASLEPRAPADAGGSSTLWWGLAAVGAFALFGAGLWVGRRGHVAVA